MSRKVFMAICCLCVSVTAAVYAASGGTHPFSVHDMVAMDRISDAQVSPDGGLVVFVLRTTDLDDNRGRTDLWLVGTGGDDLHRLTSHPENDSNPRWSPDGRYVYFVSSRSDSSQVWRIRVDGGEAGQVTDEPLDVGNLVVSPDGVRIAFTMEVYPDRPTAKATKERLDEIEEDKTGGRIYDQLFVRHWDTWKDGRRSHLFVMDADGTDGGQEGDAVNVMAGFDGDTPSKPFGGPEEITFTPDGQGLVFSARKAGRTEAWSTDFDLYYVGIEGGEEPRCLTEDNEAWDTGPVFSPDGKTLAYLAMARAGYESDRFRIVLMDWPGGRGISGGGGGSGSSKRILTEHWDRSPGSITFSNDGKTIYTTASNVGQKSMFAIDVRSGKADTVVSDGRVGVVGPAADGRVVYDMSHLKGPAELYSINASGGDVRRITDINADKVAAVRMGDFEQFSFKGWNNETVYGFVVRPIDFDADKKYPVAFLIHGGPQGSFSNSFHYRWNPQAYCGAGYATVMVDFHGSVGYGQAFCDSIRGDWGGKPLEDLQKGLAAAIKRYEWLDGDRVAAVGGSFGGYMVNWIAGKWPDRFRCLVNHDGNLDERMAYFDTEELWFPEWDHQGKPWTNPKAYEKHNPINLVGNWKTPMLVIHGANDYRVVDTQGLSTFTALQRQGIDSRLLYYPDENHWVLKPHNSILWYDTVLDWLGRYCQE